MIMILVWSNTSSAGAQTAPSFASQPRSQNLYAGNNLILGASVAGAAVTYQWQYNGLNLAGQTNFLLFLPSLSTNQAGNYNLVIANQSGSATSAAAVVTIRALPSDRMVVAWGSNNLGQLNVPAGLGQAVAVAAGDNHGVVLKTDGTVSAWGANNAGQRVVPGNLNGIVAIAAGDFHNLALGSNGLVTAWGSTQWGQTTVPSGLSGVVAVSGGYGHSLALKADGTVMAWGYSGSGATSVPIGLTEVVAISAGDSIAWPSKQMGRSWLGGERNLPAATTRFERSDSNLCRCLSQPCA